MALFGTGRAKLRKVSVSLPFGLGDADWESDESERRAAWSLYVELETRVAIQPLAAEEGLLREALNSLYSLFATTRAILREAGPDVGVRYPSVGGVAIRVLNKGLRPFLTRWHPALQAWEAGRAATTAPRDHEGGWPRAAEMRAELEKLRPQLQQYAEALQQVAGAGS